MIPHTEQALLLSERQAAEEARKGRSDAEARNAELTKNLEDAEKKVDQLQESVQRFVNTSDNGNWYNCDKLYSQFVLKPKKHEPHLPIMVFYFFVLSM